MKRSAILTCTAFAMIACAAPVSTSDEGGSMDIGNNGTGAAPAGTGAAPAGTGAAPVVGTGAAPAGTGAAPAGTGAAPAGTGAAPAGTGAAPAGTGAAPAGTGAAPGTGGGTPGPVTCTGSGWAPTDGYADNGTMCGYAWTATNGTTEVIDPPCGTMACFTGNTICASGSIPAEAPPTYPGVMIGWNVSQGTQGGAAGTWTATGSGLTVDFASGGATGQIRVLVQSGGTDYCANATSGVPIPWSGFTVGCWEPGGAAFSAGSPVTAVAIQINSTSTAQTFTDFCLNGVTLNP